MDFAKPWLPARRDLVGIFTIERLKLFGALKGDWHNQWAH
jgi:hypothetical protein